MKSSSTFIDGGRSEERVTSMAQPLGRCPSKGPRNIQVDRAVEFAVATDRYLDSLSRIKPLRVEFNALHVGYFAVPPCTTVKVHTGALPASVLHRMHTGRRSL